MNETTDPSVASPLEPCFRYLQSLRASADTLLISVSSMETMVLGDVHEELLAKIFDGTERLAESALAIEKLVHTGLLLDPCHADATQYRELIVRLVEVMDIVEQVHGKVVGYQRMLSGGVGPPLLS